MSPSRRYTEEGRVWGLTDTHTLTVSPSPSKQLALNRGVLNEGCFFVALGQDQLRKGNDVHEDVPHTVHVVGSGHTDAAAHPAASQGPTGSTSTVSESKTISVPSRWPCGVPLAG